jgi:hypothetical protein
VITDTVRIDAIAEHGLCVVAHDYLGEHGWERTWSCHYQQEKAVVGATIRDVIDLALLDLGVGNILPN